MLIVKRLATSASHNPSYQYGSSLKFLHNERLPVYLTFVILQEVTINLFDLCTSLFRREYVLPKPEVYVHIPV